MPTEEYPELVKDMDVGLACLSSRNTTPVYPGKIVGFMAAAKPVVAFLHEASDGHAIIRAAGCGYSAISGDHQVAAQLIRKMYADRHSLPELGRRGFEYACRYFSKQNGVDAMERLLHAPADERGLRASA